MSKSKRCITQSTMDKLTETFKDDSSVLDDLIHIKTCSKRKLSEYQLFLSTCLKGGKTIKDCATEWKSKRG